MKLTAIVLLTACLQVSASGYSQKVTLSEKDAPLAKVFRSIKKQTGYAFLFDEALMQQAGSVTIDVKEEPLEKALDICFKNKPLTYSIVGNIIVVKLREQILIEKEPVVSTPVPIEIIGKITDENSKGLQGASVTIKGIENGTSTDANGNFTIQLPENGGVLVISYVGYEGIETKVTKSGTLNFALKPKESKAEELVVIGYGTKKKVNLTGSVSSVSGNTLTKRPVANAATMLQGLMSGVSVLQSNGLPGQGNIKIQVRGLGTFSGAGANPLILVDGVQGNIEDLNPNNIESISVLKDAASASIYGSRAANGVILVTTKNGANSDGAIKVQYDFNYGSKTPTKLLDLVTNSPDYMRAWNTNITNSNYGVPIPSQQYTADDIAKYTNPADPIKYPSFDWQNHMITSAPTTMHNLSISGGKQTHYNLSLGYVDEKGTMEVYNYKRVNAQFNVVSNVSKRLKVGANIGLKNGTHGGYSFGGDYSLADYQTNFYITIISQPTTIMPTLPGHPELYSWRAFPFESNNWNSYLQQKELGYTIKDYSLTSQIWSDLEVIKDLHWYIKAAANYQTSQFTQFRGNTGYERLYLDSSVLGYQYAPTSLTKKNTQDIYTNIYSYLTYDKKIKLHSFNLMVGYSREEDNDNYIGAFRTNFPSPATPDLNAGGATGQTNSGASSSWAIESQFARLSYNYNAKYLLEANVRRDATSRLSPDTRQGVFPSVSAGWRFSEESFLQSSRSWLSDAKLRVSWGKLGNQNVGTYPYQALLSLTGAYSFNNTSLSPGVAQTALNNQNITWEETTTSDIGLDVTLFRKLSITLDLYKKTTTDILRGAQVTGVVGLTPPTINGGEMQNTGFDYEMSYNDYVKTGTFKDLRFGASFVLSAVKNKLVKFGASQDNGSSINEEGTPWNSWYLLQAIGIFQSQEEIAKSPKQFGENTQPGTLKYEDVNGDGIINNDDRVVMTKGVFPAFTYGFRFNAEWRGFDLYGFVQGVSGTKTYVNGWGVQPFIQGTAPTKEQLANAWTPDNHSTTTVQLGDPISFNHPSTYTFYDNSYLRLKTLQIGYSLPEKLISKLKINKVRVYFSGDNLLTKSKYPGLDPEGSGSVNFFGFRPAISYPQNRVISFGCNVIF